MVILSFSLVKNYHFTVSTLTCNANADASPKSVDTFSIAALLVLSNIILLSSPTNNDSASANLSRV